MKYIKFKKVLFVIPGFEIGGTNTSLINLLAHLDKSRYDSFVYAINNYGPLRDEIANYAHIVNPVVHSDNQPKRSISKSLFRFVKKLGVDLFPLYCRKVANSFKNGYYDAIVAFQEGRASQLVSYCGYTKTIAWVRSEYGRYLKVNNVKPEVDIYGRFTYIVNVSETAKRNFLSYLPQYKDKTYAIYNFENNERILSSAAEYVDIPGTESFTIISIGRVDPVKHFSEIPTIAKALVDKGLHFKWLIVGGKTETNPDEYEGIGVGIRSLGLEGVVYQLGYQRNPYAFLKRSNLLVCLSESETFNHTFVESRLLHVPVLSVNYESAKEFLKKEEGGMVVARQNMVDAISELITNENKYRSLRESVRRFEYDNSLIISKVNNLIGEKYSYVSD